MLAVTDLDVYYGRVQALARAGLHVARGEVVTIVGPNGAGKTTLLKAITGLVPARSGVVTLDGEPIGRESTEAIVRRGVAMVPEGRDLFGPLTVRENLCLGAYAAPRASRRARLAGDLGRVLSLFPALEARLGQAVRTLSGGEQQMVAVGRALMARPRLLLLDEPSVGLAPVVVREIFRVLETLKREGLTVLLVEQNARAAFRIADRGYVLSPGGRVEEAGPGGPRAAEAVRAAYGLELDRHGVASRRRAPCEKGGAMVEPAIRPASLDDRYLCESGTIFLTGIQALVRLPLDQSRRDRRAGLRTGTFVSGYPGSPLGGYDLALARAGRLLGTHGVVHVPGANEELAATAVAGTQMLDDHPHAGVDGVVGLWYGKGPGVDRSGDAFKHGNYAGTSRHGAVVVLSGDDHEGKSSTMPFQDDYAFLSAGIPVLYPSSVAEFLELGLHAVALSRFSGCWVALKLVAPLCDGGETVEVGPDRLRVVIPELEVRGRPFRKRSGFLFFPGSNADLERHLYEERHAAVRAYARANGLDRVEVRTPRDRIGIVTAGKSYADTRQALLDAGLGDDALRRLGVRLLRVGLLYPLDARLVREFADGLDEIVVVEEKRGFLESQVKEALCGAGRPLRVVGKQDESGANLFPMHGGMDPDLILTRLGPRLLARLGPLDGVRRRLGEIAAVRTRAYPAHPARTPNYCSGCPHNTSTVILDGQVAWGSPGCHAFASLIEQPRRRIEAMTQYGGEGVPWIGLAPFTERPHVVQNVGDGSLYHSSLLNIRFCASARANITFKILHNGVIANTGAQEAVGARSIPSLVRLLEEEGASRIALVTRRPAKYQGIRLGSVTRVYPARRHERALADLSRVRGVTVLVYDGDCANERRRRERRGRRPAPNRFVVINEEVCEGCGACGEATNCMSLHRVETEFGPRTRIHASSCSQDYACLLAACPSFVTVETRAGTGYARRAPAPIEPDALPEPEGRVRPEGPYHVHIPGVGGTGVITVNAILGHAALADGMQVLGYDQTGAAQKWGPVLSCLVVAPAGAAVAANRVGAGKADLYLALDPLAGAAPANLDRCDPARTAAVIVTSLLPTGEMIRNAAAAARGDVLADTIEGLCRPGRTVRVDARRLAEGLFGDHMMTNVLTLGVAYQAGLLPVGAESVERAIRLNGVRVEDNLQAFRYGRLYACDPARVERLAAPPGRAAADWAAALARLSRSDRRAHEALLARCEHLDAESRRMLGVRVAELIDYQDARYAERYVGLVLRVAARERSATGASGEITRAVIRGYYTLLACKDEYEVARLHLKPDVRLGIRSLFAEPRRVKLHLRPPLLHALGLERKLVLGPWFTPVLRLLRRARRLRGTPFDPFGRTAVRREERRLVRWYEALIEEATGRLRPATRAEVAELARLPEAIRGYAAVKLQRAAAARAHAAVLMDALAGRAGEAGAAPA